MNATDWPQRIPWMLIVCTVALMLLGLSGIMRGDELGGQASFFRKQAIWVALSLPTLAICAAFSYRRLQHCSYLLFGLCLFLLAFVFLMPPINGSRRWIPLGLLNLQPSEIAKLAYVLALSRYLTHRDNYRTLTGLAVPFALTAIPAVLILREPDLGTALLFFPVLFALLFTAGARLRHLGLISALGILTLPVLWQGMSAEQKSRIVTIFTQQDGGSAPTGDGYHLHQSKLVLAMGGLWGSELTGMPLDDPLAYHLPAGTTDFVFCWVGERWGLWGGLLTLLLYVLLLASGVQVALRTREPFGRLLVIGILTLLAFQVFINTAMTVGLMPITGTTLPLMSYGGSSLLATSASLGLVINVALRPGYEIAHAPFLFLDS